MALLTALGPPGFWDAFWPALAATFAGVIVGVPVALWIGRRVASFTQRAERAEGLSRDSLALQAVIAALEANVPDLRKMAKLGDQKVFMGQLQFAAWEAVQSEVFRGSADLQLKVDLATAFEEQQVVDQLNRRWTDSLISARAAAEYGAEVRSALRELLTSQAASAAERAEAVLERVNEARQRIERRNVQRRGWSRTGRDGGSGPKSANKPLR